jgi:hypothetical protein
MTRKISLSLLTVAAMLSMSCENKPKGQVQRCIDQTGRVVGDDYCDHQQVSSHYGVYPYYRWYWGGRGYGIGEQAGDGSFEPAVGLQSYRASSPEGSAIVRGGFGQGFSSGVGS